MGCGASALSVLDHAAEVGSKLDLLGANRDIIDYYTFGDTIGQ